MDSVDLMEFIIYLEDDYQIEIPDKAIDEFNTVGDIVDYVLKKQANKVRFYERDRSKNNLNGLFCSISYYSVFRTITRYGFILKIQLCL